MLNLISILHVITINSIKINECFDNTPLPERMTVKSHPAEAWRTTAGRLTRVNVAILL